MEPSSEPAFETARERDLYQYYQPRSSSDSTLSAFAQLASLRLNATRALISLIDRTNQHCLAEATQTSPLQSRVLNNNNNQDALWIGCTTFPRSLGLCEKAIEILPAKNGPRPESWRLSPLIVNDLTLDDRFKDHPFITTHPSLRFYATMPIRSRSGFNIGAISVMHDMPREGLSDVEMSFLDDVATTIMAYLEMTKVKEAHRRSENMVKGLGDFVEGRSFLREWWLDTKISKAWGPQDSKDGTEAQSRMKYKAESHSDSTPAAAERTSAGDSIQAETLVPVEAQNVPLLPSSTPPVDTKHQADSKPNMKPFAANLQETMLSANLKDVFSRASNVIRDCIEVDGALFLDASVGTFGGYTSPTQSQESTISYGAKVRRTTPTGDFETPELSIDSSDSGHPPMKTEGHGERQKMSGVLGLSVSEKSGLGEDKASEFYISVTERVLQRLLRRYPRGQVFDLREGGSLIPSKRSILQIADVAKTGSKPEKISRNRRPRGSSKQRDAKAILQMLPGARSVVFSPLWDSHRGRWFAGGFVWTTQSIRVLTRTEDLNYLVAFGNSIMAEVARLDAIAADQAKSDFISSISHELRTPLHGILASVEFLHDTTLDSFQNNMIDTIEQCGTTLLDTIQHILDFAKINNFTKSRKKGTVEESAGEGSQPRAMGLRVDIDLSVLTEDVVDSVYAGHEFQSKLSCDMPDKASGFPSEGLESASKKEELEFIVDIDWKSNWVFVTQSGALRRILMNLIGNSLKYTDAGWIKVSLQFTDIKPTSSQSLQSVITITVSDSGRGMSQEFLHGHIFTPFVQEDPMNPGTGLGLSIVQQIVRSLGGTIDVKSKQGVGTEVKVSLTLAQVLPKLPMNIKYESLVSQAREKTSGLTLGLVGFGIQPNTSKTPAGVRKIASESSRYLQLSLESMATVWFDMKVKASASWKDSPPNIYITNEIPELHGAFSGAPIIVLCSGVSMHCAYTRRKSQATPRKDNWPIHYVLKPCGPQKLAKAFAFCLGKTSQASAEHALSLSTASKALDSPQSLFAISPRSPGSWLPVNLDGYFPASASLPPSRPDESSKSAAHSGEADRIQPVLLFVDDNKINLKLLETFARKNNFEYDTAENGLLALQAFQNAQRPYDIVLMDISMPVMNGMDSARSMRNLERERGQKPATIIALTGLASATARLEAFSSGINTFLVKPIRFNELHEILKNWTPDEAPPKELGLHVSETTERT